LIERGIGKGDIVGLMLPRKSYLLSAMLGILKSGAAYLPIDPDYPDDRIEYMLNDSSAKLCITDENINSLIDNINIKKPANSVDSSDLCYCIYTSGSTGKPKGTLLTHRNVVNYVSANSKNVFFGVTGKDCKRILSVTTLGFDIFVTESLLPLVNGLEIILADEGQARIQSKLSDLLSKHPADVIQTTPTKMMSLMSDKSDLSYLRSLRTIILGGEALDSTLVKGLQAVTDADIFNIYGPTEATVWMTTAKINDADNISIGKPLANTQVYIVDKHMKLVPIGVTGELCIAGDGVSAGYLGQPELTAEKFIDNPFGEGKLYRTGDNAYWREDGNIVFVGRSDFQVKIRGLRIELGEIESAIQSVAGIERAVVVVRKDKSERQLICAFYTGQEKAAKELREEIGRSLPKYMLPHIFTHLEEMPLTTSGKTNRNDLPVIDLENIYTETEYVPAETEKEIILSQCICDVLAAEKASMLDNFFDIGGDSLKAIELTAKLEAVGYTVPIKSIFACKDIRELADALAKSEIVYDKIEYAKELPATAAQMRVYTAQMMKPDSPHYNIPSAFRTEVLCPERLEAAINMLIDRHESLRTRFENKDGHILQIIEDKAEISLLKLEGDDMSAFNTPFELSKAPLIRAGYCGNTVMLVLHHIIVDGESLNVLYKELNELYMGRELKETTQYGEFAATDGYTEDNEKYWLDIFKDEVPSLEMRTDFPRTEIQSFNGAEKYELIDIDIHNRIADKCKKKGITPYVYYMACFSILLSKLSGNEDIVIGTPVSGRTGKFLHTVGMFVNTLALRCKPEGIKKISAFLDEIRESSVSAMENQRYPFGELVRKLNTMTAGRHPLFDTMFTYQREHSADIVFGDSKAVAMPVPLSGAKCDIGMYIVPRDTDVVLLIEYCSDLFEEKTISFLSHAYMRILELCLDDTKLIKDISITDMKLLEIFNDTAADYPKDKCIHELFEEQAEKTPDKTAVVAVDKTLTYMELNEEANRIAHSLIERGIGKGSIVGIKLPRKSCFMTALFGVLKTGATYLPLDPDHPEERIKGILIDSQAKLCISEDNFSDLLDNHITENPLNSAKPDDICYCIYTSGSTGTPKGTLLYHRNLIWYMSVLKKLYGANSINMPFFTSQSVDLTVPSIYFPLITGGTVYMYNGELKNDLIKIFDNENLNIIKFTPTHISIVNKLVSAKICPNIQYVIIGGESLYKDTCIEFLNNFGKHIEIHNEYGPTEATVSCTDYTVRLDENST
ncbi:MAG: amino acid adenylation domain-containing protein, partial [Clostridia bacterium]|nr:amino acid adenylation domain-containing protein [Clostridia bacterium]